MIIELLGIPTKIDFDSKNCSSRNPSFTMFFENDKSVVFSGSDSENMRFGEIFLETGLSAIRISEGIQYEIRSIIKDLKPVLWPRDLKLLNKGNLTGGISQLYRDTSWTNAESFSTCIKRNYLDMECNKIMDDFLLA